MKKLFICILAGLLGLTTFAQTVPAEFNLTATTHGDIRVKLNNTHIAVWDTFYVFRSLFIANQPSITSAYADRLKWDGGATGLVAATGRTSLGATTIGSSLFTLTNPSAVTFLRVNANNTVTALSAADFKTALSLSQVDNESKATMFTNAALTLVPTAPTAAPGTNTTQIATTAFVLANAATGTVGTTGSPLSTHVAYFTAAGTISGSTNFLFYADSIVHKKYSIHRDTLRLQYLNGANTGSRFTVLTSTGALDSGTLNNASEQLAMHLSPLRKYMKDTKDGELAGYYTKDGQLVKNYGLKDNETGQSLGLQAIELIQGRTEINTRFIERRLLVDNIQWIVIGLLVIGLFVQQRQINKLRKK